MRQGAPLQVELAQMVVWEDEATVPFVTSGLTGGTLTAFCRWVSAVRPPAKDPLYWHHAFLLTG